MGSFYTNITLRSADSRRVVDALRSEHRQAYVSPPFEGCTVVYDRETEEQDIEVLRRLASTLSKRLDCAALAVLNHDDDVLIVTLHESGRLTDEYNSSPDYFDSGPGSEPEGGDASRMCAAFGAPGRESDVEQVLRTPWGTDDGFVFEMERHENLVTTLGLPAAAVATGYNYIETGEYPEGTSSSDFVKVG